MTKRNLHHIKTFSPACTDVRGGLCTQRTLVTNSVSVLPSDHKVILIFNLSEITNLQTRNEAAAFTFSVSIQLRLRLHSD